MQSEWKQSGWAASGRLGMQIAWRMGAAPVRSVKQGFGHGLPCGQGH